ncbi:protein cereblon [Centruroides vittatus]|uniref:protein cereblon n=1 Tax=Centruroides vittatus TaxID=120091 RepID=UPI00350E92D6
MADDILPLLGRQDDNYNTSDDEERMDDENEAANQNSEQNNQPNVSYDTSLPTQHSYLGTDLEELSGRTVLDDNSCQSLPLLALRGVVLIPGQTLPLQLFQSATVSMMKHIIEKDRTFGMVNLRSAGSTSGGQPLALVGTTAEIRSYGEENLDHLSTLRVKAEGRQRFQVLETRRQADGILIAKVKILPEIVLEDPGCGARLESLDRYRIPPPPNLDRITLQMQRLGNTCVLLPKPNRRKYNRHDFANYTWWPPWVYKQYDCEILMNKIRNELQGWNHTEGIPQNPTEFSFWVAGNLPLDDTLRLNLLAFNSAIQRLRYELSILEKYTILCCRECNAHIADRKDVFSMSLEGPQGTYVNPSGYVHETITVYKAHGLSLIGRPSTQHSWFPGYAWTIIQCRDCHTHMGWKFTAEKNKSQPEKFWGLCRSSLLPGIKSDGEEEWKPQI